MRRALTLTTLLLTTSVYNPSFALSTEEHVKDYYGMVVARVEKHITGPLAQEMAKFALFRQIHEDGKDRPHNYSAVGMIPGGLNKWAIEQLDHIGTIWKVTKIQAYDGQGSYLIEGPFANTVSCEAIALLFGKYIEDKQCFSEHEKRVWEWSKTDSFLYHDHPRHRARYHLLAEERFKILSKANGLFGPQKQHIEQQVIKHEPLFKERNEK